MKIGGKEDIEDEIENCKMHIILIYYDKIVLQLYFSILSFKNAYADLNADDTENRHVDINAEQPIHDEGENMHFSCILTKCNVDNTSHGMV